MKMIKLKDTTLDFIAEKVIQQNDIPPKPHVLFHKSFPIAMLIKNLENRGYAPSVYKKVKKIRYISLRAKAFKLSLPSSAEGLLPLSGEGI